MHERVIDATQNQQKQQNQQLNISIEQVIVLKLNMIMSQLYSFVLC